MKMSYFLPVLCLMVGSQCRAQSQTLTTDGAALLANQGVSQQSAEVTDSLQAVQPAAPHGGGGGHGGGGHGGGGHGGGGHGGGGHGGGGHGGGGHGGGGHGGGGHGGGGHGGGGHGGHGPVHGGGHHGWHGGGPRHGWHDGWRWDFNHHPGWWYAGFVFPGFIWAPEVVVGYWQCTAYNEAQEGYSASALTKDEAAYDALYDCAQDTPDTECYIPEGYCRIR